MKPTFIFTGEFARQPVELSGPWPYINPDMREKVKERLASGCYCKHDQQRTATLRRRAVAGSVSVWLQCDACGCAIGNAMAKQYHPNWHGYPLWDTATADAYQDANRARLAALPTPDERRTAHLAEYRARAAEYHNWCRTAPEWRLICEKVAWRSRGHCEACLTNAATVVHHLTYDFGKLPPAWHLKAVCDTCHTRLHTEEDDWCAMGMARDFPEMPDAAG